MEGASLPRLTSLYRPALPGLLVQADLPLKVGKTMKATKGTREGKEKAETAQERAMYALLEASSDDELNRINRRLTSILAKRAAHAFGGKASFLLAAEPGTTTNRKSREQIDIEKAISLYAEDLAVPAAIETMPAMTIPTGWPIVHAYTVKVAMPAHAAGLQVAIGIRGKVWQAIKANKNDAVAAWKSISGDVKADYIAQKAADITRAGFAL